MHQVIPTILQSPSGELGLFPRGVRSNGQPSWDVARPVPEGWEAIGSVAGAEDGYRGWGAFELRAMPSVTDAAATLARLAAEYDTKHGHPAPLAIVPAEDVGPGGRVYGEVAA